ncbi:hypothetical protein [Pontibacter rugosus]
MKKNFVLYAISSLFLCASCTTTPTSEETAIQQPLLTPHKQKTPA